jgi:hypothetical protein
LNKKYGKIVNIDIPISEANNIILLTFQMWFDFLQLYDTINWQNNKSDEWHYIKNKFHFTPCFFKKERGYVLPRMETSYPEPNSHFT